MTRMDMLIQASKWEETGMDLGERSLWTMIGGAIFATIAWWVYVAALLLADPTQLFLWIAIVASMVPLVGFAVFMIGLTYLSAADSVYGEFYP